MEIVVSSRMAVAGVVLQLQKDGPDNKVVAISITDPKSDPVNLPLLEADILRLSFHDLDRTYPISCPAIVLFDTVMAQRIKDFIMMVVWTYMGRNVDDRKLFVVVHCEAGISRSAGVAAALSKHFKNDDSMFFNNASKYLPNRLAYRVLLNTLNGMENAIPNVSFSPREGDTEKDVF